jgi:hypothetical protein
MVAEFSTALVPGIQVRSDLEVVLKEYTEVRIANTSTTNRPMLDRLKRIGKSVELIIKGNIQGLEAWSNSCRPIGNWPELAWIAFGGPNTYLSQDSSMTININYHFATDGSGIYLVLLPFAKGWKSTFGKRWTSEFEPMRREFRNALKWIRDYGFLMDDRAKVGTMDTSGANMREGYIFYKFYPRESLPDEAILQRDLVMAAQAQQQIINLHMDPNRLGIWGIKIDVPIGQSEEEMWAFWKENNVVTKGSPNLIEKGFSRLCQSDITKRGFLVEAARMNLDPSLTESLWNFVYDVRPGDTVLAVNQKNEVLAEGKILPEANFDETISTPIWKRVEWQEYDQPRIIPSDLISNII